MGEGNNLENCIKALNDFSEICPKSSKHNPNAQIIADDRHNAGARCLGRALDFIEAAAKATSSQECPELYNQLTELKGYIISMRKACANGTYAGQCGNCLDTYRTAMNHITKNKMTNETIDNKVEGTDAKQQTPDQWDSNAAYKKNPLNTKQIIYMKAAGARGS